MNNQNARTYVILGLLIAVAGTCLFLVVFEEINGRSIDSTVQTLLSFIVGVLGNQLGSQTGGQQTQDVVKTITNGVSNMQPGAVSRSFTTTTSTTAPSDQH